MERTMNGEADQQVVEGERRGDPPAESIGYLLRRAHRTFNKVLQSRLKTENISIGMWHYLRELWEEDGIDQRDLSRRTSNLETSVVSAMALLEKHGLVWREQDSKDRRRKFVHLTDRGRALQVHLEPARPRSQPHRSARAEQGSGRDARRVAQTDHREPRAVHPESLTFIEVRRHRSVGGT